MTADEDRAPLTRDEQILLGTLFAYYEDRGVPITGAELVHPRSVLEVLTAQTNAMPGVKAINFSKADD